MSKRMVAKGKEVTLTMTVSYPSPWELEVRGEVIAQGSHVVALYEVLAIGVGREIESGHPVAAGEMRALMQSFETVLGPALRGMAGNNGHVNNGSMN